MKKFGFTLAEILITLTIIGIIAAIVMPALFSNVERATLEKQTAKFYNRLVTAFSTYKTDKESPTITNTEFNADNFVRDYFNAERCDSFADCFPAAYSFVNNNQPRNNFAEEYSSYNVYRLKDGTVFLIVGYNEDESVPIDIFFDVNGIKGPNKVGRDFWSVKIFYDGSIDEGGAFPRLKKGSQTDLDEMKNSLNERYQNCLNGNNPYGGCFGHFMRNGFKFDY